jgi:hypothetical protein
MAVRPLIAPYQVITDGNMSASTITSSVTVLQQTSMVSYGYSWTGTSPVGTITVQVSNDYSKNADGSVRNAGTWNNVFFSVSGSIVSSAPVSGNTGNGLIDIGPTGAYAIRTVYTKTSGIGTLQATIAGKVT